MTRTLFCEFSDLQIRYFSHFFADIKSTTENEKTLLSVIFAVMSLTTYAEDPVREIELKSVDITTRSIVSLPEATIFKDILSVTFKDSGLYSLYVENSVGEIIYSSALPADGMEYSYDLSGVGDGLVRLVIEGLGGEYEGYFTLY